MNLNGRPDDYIEGNGSGQPASTRRRLGPVQRVRPRLRTRAACRPSARTGTTARADHLPRRPGHQPDAPAARRSSQQASSYHGMGHILNFSDQSPGAARRLHGRPEGPRHRVPRRAAGARDGLRELGHPGRLRRLPHRYDQAHRVRRSGTTSSPHCGSTSQREGKNNFIIFGESFDGDDALDGSYTIQDVLRQHRLLSAALHSLRRSLRERDARNQSPTTVIQQLWDTDVSRTTATLRSPVGSRTRRGRRAHRGARQLHRQP